MRAPVPSNEGERLLALADYQAFETDPEEGFDRVTRLAQHVFKVPVALVSLVGEDRQWLKSCIGLPGVRETSRDAAFCAYTILSEELLVVPDATLDPRFEDNPLVTGWPHIRFYAGTPLRTPEGLNIGSLCVIDAVPRNFAAEDLKILRELGQIVIDEFELRKALRQSESQKRLLASGEEQYRLLAESIQGVVFQGVQREPQHFDFEYVSPGSLELLRIAPEDLVADKRTLLSLFHPDEIESAYRSISEALRTNCPFLWEGRFVLDEGVEKWVRILAQISLQTGGCTHWRGIMIDVTEARERESALALAKEEAERANLAKSVFLSRMSHELRTPLTAILGFAQMLETEPMGTDAKEDLSEIQKAGVHLLGLINEVLDLSRAEQFLEPALPDPISVCDVLVEAYGLLRLLMDSQGVRLRAVHRCNGAYVCADRGRLKQTFINVLTNAVKYNRAGGSVRVETFFDEVGRVAVAITDQGEGIPAGRVDRLFVPFDRLGAETGGIEGTGLGLAITKSLVEAMGGTIDVKSILGEGSTFTIRLPRDESEEERRAA